MSQTSLLARFAALCIATLVAASWYDEVEREWNLNDNPDATSVFEYTIPSWENHTYQPSPQNWRMPFYSFFPDRFVNGDPTNDDSNHTTWEFDITGTQLRHGGDFRGIVDSLDYLHGMGVRGIYLAGSVLINFPWEADCFSPLDHTIVDHHHGTVAEIRATVQAIHDRGMYVIFDNTMATMGNLFGFVGHFNSSADWSFTEHEMVYNHHRQYRDFTHGNVFLDECNVPYPRFWDQSGHLTNDENTTQMVGCMDSEWDQYGDAGAFGVYPEWQKQLSKFNGVQDRLREWRPSVRAKLEHLSCMLIQGLDVDGFRVDKAMQVTIDAQGSFSHAMRECARQVGKDNFFIPGEVVNGNANGAVYYGRGLEPEMAFADVHEAAATNSSRRDRAMYIRDQSYHALDAGAFQYTTYRSLLRYLGMDGDLLASFDAPVNFQDQWQVMAQTNDFSNAYTGEFDPRHMYGVSNQDVFRWPGMINGTERQLSGDFIITMLMPGIPMVSWGEEQAFFTHDNTASNYIYGRQAMSTSQAWRLHGCTKLPNANLHDVQYNSSLTACQEDSIALDHRDPSHPVYGVLKQMYEMRRRYPVLNDGWTVTQLSSLTTNISLPGSFYQVTETGLWSVLRARMEDLQDFEGQGMFGNQPVWLLHSNYKDATTYTCDCTDPLDAILSPFDAGSTVKNMFYPFDEWTLDESPRKLGVEGSTAPSGCLPKLNMTMYGWKAFVPVDTWIKPSPIVTGFSPGHDARLLANTGPDEASDVEIEVRFSDEMDCESFLDGFSVVSTTDSGQQVQPDIASLNCSVVDPIFEAYYYGPSPSVWVARMTLANVYDGVHVVGVKDVASLSGNMTTDAHDHFMFRVGQAENPFVFPHSANYSSSLLFKDPTSLRKRTDFDHAVGDTSIISSDLMVHQKAAGAEKWRFSMSFGAIWSDWMDYVPGNVSLPSQSWTGSDRQRWEGDHVKIQYWSRAVGSANHQIEGDLAGGNDGIPRRFPHLFIHGTFNEYGYDSGLANSMHQLPNGTWAFDFMTEWPSQFQVNVWGISHNGRPDVSFAFGDVDNDTVLDRISPHSLQPAVVNVTNLGPGSPHLAWRILFNDADLRYWLVPVGNRWIQLIIFILLAVVPLISASLAVWVYKEAFAVVKFNQWGLVQKKSSRLTMREGMRSVLGLDEKTSSTSSIAASTPAGDLSPTDGSLDATAMTPGGFAGAFVTPPPKRRTVLIATMEYDIEDWGIKIKIGGLGVMAQLMGKNLDHQDLIWVVPCVGGIEYPIDSPGAPITVTISGKAVVVQVQYHKLRNITYVLLDAPMFRQQTAAEPYPTRMDDIPSATYYSAWNQCIAETIRRWPIGLYHINDYHGTIAPLYLLPDTIPCCLSLHNAEFQGLWPMRTPREVARICHVFNLPESVVRSYVQFGDIFNLLHAGASILRIHQKGFGAVGVSRKYGKRSWARYPIFWGLSRVGALPNPDPTDVAAWDRNKPISPGPATIDADFESARANLRLRAQEWAGLTPDPTADLFVFVGRWSHQKGVDLIADVFPSLLERYPSVQLICVGPTIDLYGRFAALKLDVLTQRYPQRVYSRPQFTALPDYLFGAAEFALIPSRDEPFGLVAVEFGRKGALGVGSRVGGLGQMPGWWYTLESTTSRHMMDQFKLAITAALASDHDTRAQLRALSAQQRFPVAQWKENLEILQLKAIDIHKRNQPNVSRKHMGLDLDGHPMSVRRTPSMPSTPGWMTPRSGRSSPTGESIPSFPSISLPMSPASTPPMSRAGSVSLGRHFGPGHSASGAVLPGTSGILEERHQAEQNTGSSSLDSQDEERISTEQALRAHKQSIEGKDDKGDAQPPLFKPEAQTRGDRTTGDDQSSFLSPREQGAVSQPPTSTTPGTSAVSMLLSPPIPGGILDIRPHSPSPSRTPGLESKSHKAQQDLMPIFSDSTGLYYRAFEQKLRDMDGKNSENKLCIERFLMKSEKEWFNRLHTVKMSAPDTPAYSNAVTPAASVMNGFDGHRETMGQFLLPDNYTPPTGIKRILNLRIGDWPVYSFLLALGQILAANSYQITLLAGQVGQPPVQLYAIASIYLVSSMGWWLVFRRLPVGYVLTLPWALYGAAFFLLAFAPYSSSLLGRAWVQHTATGLYAAASSSGGFFFSQNFGSTATVPVRDWAFRACAIQGTQQIYIVALWAWGARLATASARGFAISYQWQLTAVGVPIALLLWAVGVVLFMGLPDFYRQKPGAVPSFYSSLARRNLILWSMLAGFVQNIFLSAPYGRTWKFLWSSDHAPVWAIILLVLFFFVGLWSVFLYIFAHLSARHTWILPCFALGLGAPLWSLVFWATSGTAAYIPWAGGPVASALVARALWCWLALLATMQGVGIGMMLLQTLVRFHITAALVAAQIVGSIATIIARADGLNSIGPGPTFPSFAAGWRDSVAEPWLWIGLLAQLMIIVGFFRFFRKEVLSKP